MMFGFTKSLTTTIAIMLSATLGIFLMTAPAHALWPSDEPTPSTADASDEGGIAWGVSPGTAEGADQRAWVEHTLAPGASVTEHMVVSNVGNIPATFHLVAADGVINDEGGFSILPSGETSTDAGTWITLGEPSIDLAPGETKIIPFTVAVPSNATPGDHPAGVAAALRSESENGVGVESRVGFRVMIRVSGELAPALAVTEVKASYRGTWNPFATGSLIVTYTIKNTGNARLGGAGTVQADGLIGGKSVGLPTIKELLPGQTRTGTVQIDGVQPSGKIDAQVSVQGVAVENANADISQVKASGHQVVTAMPWPHLVLLLSVILVVAAIVLVRRRQRKILARLVEEARAEGQREALAAV